MLFDVAGMIPQHHCHAAGDFGTVEPVTELAHEHDWSAHDEAARSGGEHRHGAIRHLHRPAAAVEPRRALVGQAQIEFDRGEPWIRGIVGARFKPGRLPLAREVSEGLRLALGSRLPSAEVVARKHFDVPRERGLDRPALVRPHALLADCRAAGEERQDQDTRDPHRRSFAKTWCLQQPTRWSTRRRRSSSHL